MKKIWCVCLICVFFAGCATGQDSNGETGVDNTDFEQRTSYEREDLTSTVVEDEWIISWQDTVDYVTEWEDQIFFRKYPHVIYDGNEYKEILFYYPTTEAPKKTEIEEKQRLMAESIGKVIGEGMVWGYHPYLIESGTDAYAEKEEVSVNVYEIWHVNPAVAILVEDKEEELYSVYINERYEPQTLGDLIEDMGLKENVNVIGMKNTDYLWEFLENNEGAENKGSDLRFVYKEKAEIKIEVPLFDQVGEHKTYIALNTLVNDTEGYYLIIGAMYYRRQFYIEKAEGDKFIEYVEKYSESE